MRRGCGEAAAGPGRAVVRGHRPPRPAGRPCQLSEEFGQRVCRRGRRGEGCVCVCGCCLLLLALPCRLPLPAVVGQRRFRAARGGGAGGQAGGTVGGRAPLRGEAAARACAPEAAAGEGGTGPMAGAAPVAGGGGPGRDGDALSHRRR